MTGARWTLTSDERSALADALDALLPPEGSFPLPSATGIIDDFILERVPVEAADVIPYPRLHAESLRAILPELAARSRDADMTTALEWLEAEQPETFLALWRLTVFGYYSRPETIAAIQRDLTPGYHGAPQPIGYNHLIAPWDPDDPLQLPQDPRGSYVETGDVRRVDLSRLSFDRRDEGGAS